MEAILQHHDIQTETGLGIQDWGLIPYTDALNRQMDLVGLVSQELARDTLVFCTHPPVVTVGRATQAGDVAGWGGELIEVNRGGRATYHGPNQIVVYPILDLGSRGRDLHKYMRALEAAIVATLSEFGVEAVGRSIQEQDRADGQGTEPVEATGVWVGSKKIASIGIGVRKWVSFHGLALNVDADPCAFRGLKPCGFTPSTMTSLECVLGQKPDRPAVQAALAKHLVQLLA